MGRLLASALAATTIGLAGCGTAGMITDGFGSVLGSQEPKTSTLDRTHDAECKESGLKPALKASSIVGLARSENDPLSLQPQSMIWVFNGSGNAQAATGPRRRRLRANGPA